MMMCCCMHTGVGSGAFAASARHTAGLTLSSCTVTMSGPFLCLQNTMHVVLAPARPRRTCPGSLTRPAASMARQLVLCMASSSGQSSPCPPACVSLASQADVAVARQRPYGLPSTCHKAVSIGMHSGCVRAACGEGGHALHLCLWEPSQTSHAQAGTVLVH